MLVGLIIGAPQLPQVRTICLLFGYHIGGMGIAFVINEATNGGYNSNQLRTDGTRALCRFPLYGGVVMCAVGASIATFSFARLSATVLLYVMLSYKACSEEKQLLAMNSPDYWNYWMASAPRLLPDFGDPERIKAAFNDAQHFANGNRYGSQYGNQYGRNDRNNRY